MGMTKNWLDSIDINYKERERCCTIIYQSFALFMFSKTFCSLVLVKNAFPVKNFVFSFECTGENWWLKPAGSSPGHSVHSEACLSRQLDAWHSPHKSLLINFKNLLKMMHPRPHRLLETLKNCHHVIMIHIRPSPLCAPKIQWTSANTINIYWICQFHWGKLFPSSLPLRIEEREEFSEIRLNIFQ
jgi:hypothetical protein